MDGFETFTIAHAINMHFNTKYDAFKYRFKTRVNQKTYWGRPDKYQLTKIGKRFKTKEEVMGIVNRRRNKGDPKGTRIPSKPWLELCDKLSTKYTFHPLRMKEEKDKFIEEQDDGTKILVNSLSPGSPR